MKWANKYYNYFMFDLLASLAFFGLLLTTSVLKMVGSKDTQEFKLYLLFSTLAFLACKIYNAVKYYEGVRLQAANEESTPQSDSTSTHQETQRQPLQQPYTASVFAKYVKFQRSPSIIN